MKELECSEQKKRIVQSRDEYIAGETHFFEKKKKMLKL
jgi:hypothetical protein